MTMTEYDRHDPDPTLDRPPLTVDDWFFGIGIGIFRCFVIISFVLWLSYVWQLTF